MGVVRMYMWLVGVAVRWYIDILMIIITFPYSTCISSFFGSSISTSLFIFKMFFRSCLCYFCEIYSKRCSKNIRDCSKIEITQTWRYNYIDKNIRPLCARASPETSTCEVPRDVSRKLQLILCAIMAS